MKLPDLDLAVKVVSILDSVKDDAIDQSVWARDQQIILCQETS